MNQEEYIVKCSRRMRETYEGVEVSNDEYKSSSELFASIYKKISDKNTLKYIANEICIVLKRIQDDINFYSKNTTKKETPGIFMDEIFKILSSYSSVVRNKDIFHTIKVSEEILYIEVSSKAGSYYPEMRKYKLSSGGPNNQLLFLSGEILADTIMQVFGPRFKSTEDFIDIIKTEKFYRLSYINVLKNIYYSTFKKEAAGSILKDGILIDVNKLFLDKNFDFSLKDGSIIFSIAVNDFIPVLFYYLNRTPNLFYLLNSSKKNNIYESLEKNIRLFTDEIDKARILLERRN